MGFRSLAALDREGTRETQHRRLTEAMLANQKTEQPVHTWELPQAGTGTKAEQTVQDIMSTDLFTVLPNATVQMVASVMDWRYVRHVPVEDEEGRFCGLVSHRDLLHVLAGCRSALCPLATPVREIMNASPVTASPDTPLAVAIERMRDAPSDSLPVVSGGRLVGIVTSQDVLAVLARMLHRGASQATG